MAMERTFFFMFLWLAVEGNIGDCHFMETKMTWLDAQTHCRKLYTDLYIIPTAEEMIRLSCQEKGWIGLSRSSVTWLWAGGGNVTYAKWAKDNPKDDSGDFVKMEAGEWTNENQDHEEGFLCIKVNVKTPANTWEEALKHCRENHVDLASLQSVQERLLAQTAIRRGGFTDPVWTGLRYLNDRWMWINGDPVAYEDWPQGGDQDHLCPMVKRCGALTKNKGWVNVDCQEKLNFICI